MNPLDILKRTPKTNCGQCGYPACLAFAANVAKSGEDPKKCPYIDLEGLDLTAQDNTGLEEMGRKHDLQLIRHLKEKISSMDFSKISKPLGANWSKTTPDTLTFSYLGQIVQLDKKGILLDGLEPEDPRDQILLYNYIHSGGGRAPDGHWIGLESLPNSISKVKTLATYCEERLAKLFSGRSQKDIIHLCAEIPLRQDRENSASAALFFEVLPMLPLYVLFWDKEPEDGFEAKVKILFDHHVLDFLDLESLIFSAERLADRLINLTG